MTDMTEDTHQINASIERLGTSLGELAVCQGRLTSELETATLKLLDLVEDLHSAISEPRTDH